MTDLTKTIDPKSDQINADDLIGGPKTITVSRVSLLKEADQPIAINFEGDNNKPYKPCKSMRRVLVTVWGGDGNAYAGRSMTLYRDPSVQFGGVAVGGIRISHMSDIDRDMTMALTATRASRKPFTVKPLARPQSSAAAKSSPVANNGRADGIAQSETPKPSLAERVAKVEAALRDAKTPADKEKAWRLGVRVRQDLDQADPDRLVELELLYEQEMAGVA